MKQLIIICEGQTEQSFCQEVIAPYLYNKCNIQSFAPVIATSGGGIVKWEKLKKEINSYLYRENKNTFVTTFIDYYGLHQNLDYPQNRKTENVAERRTIVSQIEQAMQYEIEEHIRYRFIPYIQLHEFESLIFSKVEVLGEWFAPNEIKERDYIYQTIKEQPDPELINDGIKTAPSKRLQKAIPTYDKVTYGTILTSDIGLDYLRKQCTNFNNWITKLENI